MFVALEPVTREAAGPLGRLRNRLRKPKLWLEAGECLGGRYGLLKAEDKPDWNAVERICGAYASRLLLPEGLALPEGGRLARLPLDRFEAQLLLHTACDLVDRTRMPMYRRVLGLVDGKAEYSGMLPALLRHYTAVKVLTEHPEAYVEAASQVMAELGAPVLMAEGLASFQDCVLLLSPGAFYTGDKADFSCPVLAGGPFVAAGRFHLFSGAEAQALPEVLAACPNGIRPHDFAGALYTCCNVESTDFQAERLLVDYKAAGPDEAARAMLEACGLDTPRHGSRTH